MLEHKGDESTMSHIAALTQLRVFVPANRPTETTIWEEMLCNTYGGFSVNPNEQIKGAWRNPNTGKVEFDIMSVYYIWIDEALDIDHEVAALGVVVQKLYGETAVSVIVDTHVKPMIVS